MRRLTNIFIFTLNILCPVLTVALLLANLVFNSEVPWFWVFAPLIIPVFCAIIIGIVLALLEDTKTARAISAAKRRKK